MQNDFLGTKERKLLISLLNSSKITRVLEFDYVYSIHTFNDKQYFYNETLFNRYAGFEFAFTLPYNLIRNIVFTKLRVVKAFLSSFLGIFKENDFIVEAIKEKITCIDLLELSIDFELEKAGYTLKLSKKKRQKRIKDIEQKESFLFGTHVSQNKEESILCFNYIKRKFERNKNLLTFHEQKDFLEFLNIFEVHLRKKGYQYETYVAPKIIRDWMSKYFFQDFGNIIFSREEYISIFRLTLDILKMKHVGIYTGTFFSINFTRSNLNIPSDASYDKLSLERILRLIYHEIIGHGYTWKNQLLFFGKLKGAQYREKEEGFATLLESLLWGEHIHTIDPKPFATARIFAGELLVGDDLKYFNSLYRIITRQKTGNKTGTFLRLKKNYPFDDRGVSHIDIAYMRGMQKVQHFLALSGKPEALLSGKVSLSALESGEYDTSSDPRFHLPYPISDSIIHGIYSKLGHSSESFDSYMNKKYGSLKSIFRPINKLSHSRKVMLDALIDTIFLKISLSNGSGK